MMLRNALRKGWLTFALASTVLVGLVSTGCNEHKFVATAEIDVQPQVITYQAQRRDNYIKEVLVRNSGVVANLDLYEVKFYDQSKTSFLDAVTSGSTSTPIEEAVSDQRALLKFLDTYKSKVDTTLTYTTLTRAVVTNHTCTTDTDCYCDSDSSSDCAGKAKLGDTSSGGIGKPFVCESSPLASVAGDKVCLAYFKFINNAGDAKGQTQVASWGKVEDRTCTSDTDCTKIASNYVCLSKSDGTKKCGTDLKMAFSVDYGLEQFVATSSTGIDTTKAAVWKAVTSSDGAIGHADPSATVTTCIQNDAPFYGLNRCDQIAIKRRYLSAIDDGVEAQAFTLVPESRANYTIMAMPSTNNASETAGLVASTASSNHLIFCDKTDKKISYNNIILDDPMANETCLNADGSIDESKLSINPANFKVNELPLRLIYQVDLNHPEVFALSGKIFSMGVRSNAFSGGSSETPVTITMPVSKGGPPMPVITVEDSDEQPEPLQEIFISGLHSFVPSCEGGLCDASTPDAEQTKASQPFYYQWQVLEKPQSARAGSVYFSAHNCSRNNGQYDCPAIDGKMQEDGQPRFWFPVAGTYKIALKVRTKGSTDSGVESQDSPDNCPDCVEYATMTFNVKSKSALLLEMTWEHGYTDCDLYLVHYRDNGTFSISGPLSTNNKVIPPSTATETCPATACPLNWACNSGSCDNTCNVTGGVDSCQDTANGGSRGWDCLGTDSDGQDGYCAVNGDSDVPCEADSDCPSSSYCEAVWSSTYSAVCSKAKKEAVNDTCWFNLMNPIWGDWQNTDVSCTTDKDCRLNTAVGANSLCGYITAGKCATIEPKYSAKLNRDETHGWGPENITVALPADGRYRVVARFYTNDTADPSPIQGPEVSPLSPLRMTVKVYLFGDPAMEMTHEFQSQYQYWKAFDINWKGTTKSDVSVKPVCSGWTWDTCQLGSNTCEQEYGDGYSCKTRNWNSNKYCQAENCRATNGGAPDVCNPVKACSSDTDCADQATAKFCGPIQANYCYCEPPQEEFGAFPGKPYSNPFTNLSPTLLLDPNGTNMKASIWCDKATDVYDVANNKTCASLYSTSK